MESKIKLYFFALGALGRGLSGSDRIFIEFSRRWSRKYPVNIYVWTEGYEMCGRQNLKGKNISFIVSTMKPWKDFGFLINYLARIFEGIRIGLTLNLENIEETILYSASDFWMDTFPCLILKLRFKNVKWVGTWYQTAPSPLKGFTEADREKKYRLNALFYWLSQVPVKPLISNFADYVLVNNHHERKQFSRLDKVKKTIVVLGAVDIDKINIWKKRFEELPKKYDAVFQGRFHPQKGVVELIEIWRKVVDKIPNAKLAMIGDGPLMGDVRNKIHDLRLENNIKLFGYLFDGPEKYRIFAQSKIVLHPAFYDSGGMAAAEAMAFGLPCVGFNLKAFRDYYPKGMVKVRKGDLSGFSDMVLMLLKNSGLVKRLGREAFQTIEDNWSWENRASTVLINLAL